MKCPSGIRSQIVCAPKMRSLVRKTQHVVQNFPSCWDGVVCANRPFNAYRILKWLSFQNTDSPDHRSHVSFLSAGPDNGTCADPQFPKTLPRIFMEVRKCHILNNYPRLRIFICLYTLRSTGWLKHLTTFAPPQRILTSLLCKHLLPSTYESIGAQSAILDSPMVILRAIRTTLVSGHVRGA